MKSLSQRTAIKSLAGTPVLAAPPAMTLDDVYGDCTLLTPEEQIRPAYHDVKECEPEILRLQRVWSDELMRLEVERRAGRLALTREECWGHVTKIAGLMAHQLRQVNLFL